jgi:Flp pilus assembly protein TadB
MKTVIKLGYDDFIPTTPSGRIFTSWFIIIGVCFGSTYIAFAFNYIHDHTEKRSKIINKELANKLHSSSIKERTKSFSKYISTLRRSISRSIFDVNNDSNINILDISSKSFDAELRKLYKKMFIDVFIIVIIILLGMSVMMAFEKWSR